MIPWVGVKKKKVSLLGAEEMTQWLKAPAALTEDPSSVPRTTQQFTGLLSLESNVLSRPLWTLGMYTVHMYIAGKHSFTK